MENTAAAVNSQFCYEAVALYDATMAHTRIRNLLQIAPVVIRSTVRPETNIIRLYCIGNNKRNYMPIFAGYWILKCNSEY